MKCTGYAGQQRKCTGHTGQHFALRTFGFVISWVIEMRLLNLSVTGCDPLKERRVEEIRQSSAGLLAH